jgi:hypothetical protein
VNHIRTVLITLTLLPTCHLVPARAENVVRWATPLPAESFDPYRTEELLTYWVDTQVNEVLVGYDPDGARSSRNLDGESRREQHRRR